jgi:hypothetical protein
MHEKFEATPDPTSREHRHDEFVDTCSFLWHSRKAAPTVGQQPRHSWKERRVFDRMYTEPRNLRIHQPLA